MLVMLLVMLLRFCRQNKTEDRMQTYFYNLHYNKTHICLQYKFIFWSVTVDHKKQYFQNKIYSSTAFIFMVNICFECTYIAYKCINVRGCAIINSFALHCTLDKQKTQECSVLYCLHLCVV